MRLEIQFQTEYRYEPAVTGGVSVLRMRPRSRPGMVVEEAHIVARPGMISRSYVDAWGTLTDLVEFDRPHSVSNFEMRAIVDTVPREAETTLQPWEQSLFLANSARAKRSEVDNLGWTLANEGESWIAVESLLRWIPQRFRYEVGTTDAETTITDFIEVGAGVCQDFAHVMIAMLRTWGWPARYVSGYFFSAPSTDTQIVAEAMHAWVEAYRPGIGWIGLDATAGEYTDERYVPVGYGRDYNDVAPVRGVIQGGSHQENSARLQIDQHPNLSQQ